VNTTRVSLDARDEKAVGLFESLERSRVRGGADEVWVREDRDILEVVNSTGT